MAKFQNPGSFFLGTLVPSEQKFLKKLIENAVKNGYRKFLEPCAGAFAMSHLAVQSGFKPFQIDASDVSMFSSIMGYAITGQSLEELCLHAKGFSDDELLDPATALYAWKYLSTAKNAGKDYFYNYLIDLEQRRETHIQTLREQIERAKSILGGMRYRALDMWKHIEEVLNDPHALMIANPPTYTAGFEKYYRKLWTHNFTGASIPMNFAVFIDGKITGVFGLDKAALTMGAFGTRVSDSVFLMYGMTVPHKIYRLNRLLTMLAQNKDFIMSVCTDLEREKAKSLKTVQMTKYPEAKEMRGIMKLEERKPDDKFGYRLVYKSDFKNRTEQQTLIEWLRREKKWRTERQKNQK